MEEALKKIRQTLMQDKEIKEFCRKYNITNELFERNITLFYQHYEEIRPCLTCLGKKPCKTNPEGYQSSLLYINGAIERRYIKCPYLDNYIPENLELLFFPSIITVGELLAVESREEVYQAIKAYNANPLIGKGLYLYGKYGTGKTFILLKVAQELTKKNIKVIFAYYPDLARYIKSNITEGGVEGLVKQLKEIPVLMLDDIGGENNSPYIRDEILGPILQYRMYYSKPTFMTSNLSIDQLQNHFKDTKDAIDGIKASRIIERILYLMKPIKLADLDFRRALDN